MGYQIVRMPGPRETYAIWSTFTDSFASKHCRREHVRYFFEAIAIKRVQQEVEEILTKIDAGEPPYHQFTMTYQEMLDTIEYRNNPPED